MPELDTFAGPLHYGDTADFVEPVAPGSAMDGFVVFDAAVVDREDARIEVDDDLPVHEARDFARMPG